LAGLLLRGEIDLALCSVPAAHEELLFEPLLLERFLLLMPQGHQLAASDAVEPAQLQGHRLLITAPDCPYRRRLEPALQEAGAFALDTMVVNSMTLLVHYVEQGLGIALVPAILLLPDPPAGTLARPMKGVSVDMPIGLLSRRGEYPLQAAGARLYSFLKDALSSNEGGMTELEHGLLNRIQGSR
jgi:DNA-binding transcriptional LysR family regulator